MSNRLSPSLAIRVGSAALGLLVGLVMGLLLAVFSLVALKASPSFPLFVFGSGAVGAFIGLVFPEAALRIVQGAIHFLFGFSLTLGHQGIKPDHDAPQWLRVLFWLGVAAAVGAYVLVRSGLAAPAP